MRLVSTSGSRDWGRYGISAFYASSDEEVDALCGSRLVRFADIVVNCEHTERPNPYNVPEEGAAMTDIDESVDLRVDLNTEDDTGLPWSFLRDARDPALVREGAWLVVGSGRMRAVAQVAQIEGDLVWVRPLPGPVSQYRHLLAGRGAA